MKIRTRILLGCLSIGMLFMSACQSVGHGSGNAPKDSMSIMWGGNTSTESEFTPIDEGYKPQPVLAENLREWNEAVRYYSEDYPFTNTATYRIKSVEFTKEIGAHEMSQIKYDATRAEHDEKGNLIGDDYVFVWLGMEVINQSAEVMEDGVNFGMSKILEDNYAADVVAEAVYISYAEEGRRPEERFYYRLKPGERREYEIGYLLRKETAMLGELYYLIGYGGTEAKAVGNRFLRLEDFWKEYLEKEALPE